MNVGLGLPISDPAALLDWARRADAGPFTTLGLLDRLVYDNPEPLIALALVAGATTRVRVQTEVLLAPLREPALLAKQAATLDRISGGRLVLGLGVGGREDDHLVAGTDIRTRGRRLDEQMAVMRRLWSGEPYGDGAGMIGPLPARQGGPEVLFGGFQPAALARVARWGDGFLAAAAPSWAGGLIDTVRADPRVRRAVCGARRGRGHAVLLRPRSGSGRPAGGRGQRPLRSPTAGPASGPPARAGSPGGSAAARTAPSAAGTP
ncbi:LLM class flavin-dependent oxidoreductase [Nonomuraea sp. NPDC050451]|uniref:LLM class flavin-dependent oxidoreductase n=1 Tax=Nonomuraea sp. NPDC050451 TaxID=3364364 RepID=UPI003793E48A